MTFLELLTDLSGIYISFKFSPLTFKEIVEFKNIKNYCMIYLNEEVFQRDFLLKMKEQK